MKSILFKLDSVRSRCPISRARGYVLNARAFRIELEFRNVGFCGEGKTGVPGEKPLGAEKRTNNKLNPHMTSSPRIEPGPHWWKASALTTAPSLLPPQIWLFLVDKWNHLEKRQCFLVNVTDVVLVSRVFFTRLSYFFTMEFETYTKNMKFERGFWKTKGTLSIYF